jgi:AsmA protein
MRLTRILAIIVAVIAGLFAIAAIAFLLFFDPSDFREDVEQAVKESTGRDLAIEGEIGLQVFPWLAVSVADVTLSNAPGFGDEPFASFERAELSVQVWPLLARREIAVATAAVDGLTLNLAVDANQRDNWSDLAEPGDGATVDEGGSQVGGSRGGTLEIAGIAIRNATISYANAAVGGAYSFSEADLEIGRIAGDDDGITIDGISLDGVISGVADAPSRYAISTSGIALDTAGNIATLEPVKLSAFDVDIRADVEPFSYAGAIEPAAIIEVDTFSPRSLMHMFGVAPPETVDPSVLSRVTLAARADVRAEVISLGDVTIELDDTTFTGSLAMPRTVTGAYRFDLSGDAIDLNRYMAPATEEDAAAAEDVAPVEIPADLVRALNARGKLAIADVLMGGLELGNVTLGLDSANGRMRVHPIAAALYGGGYEGDVRIDASGATPVLSVNETVTGVDLAQLAQAMFEQENITGSINGNFKLSGRGKDMGEVQRSLGGTMNFELLDGTYEGTDVWYELRRARALLKKEEPPEPVLPARTKFTSVKASGVVTDGVMRNDDFVADLPFMQLTGNGEVNLPEATIDYRLSARIFRKPEALEAATPEELDDFTKTVIPLKITGAIASPSVKPDVEKMLRERAKEEIREKLEDKLLDLLKR